MNMILLDPKVIVLAAVLIVIAALLVRLYVRNRKSTTAGLRQKFGSEYDRAVLAHGSERKAELKLEDREKRVEKLKILYLDPMEHERDSKQWEAIESRFVDWHKRWYPHQRAADISADRPRVQRYRSFLDRLLNL